MYTDKFNTPTGKGKLFPVDYAEQNERVDSEYPFLLNSGRILFHYHTSTMSRKTKVLRDFINQSYILINPIDALKIKVENGKKVVVKSKRGQLETFIKISDEVLEGELFMPWHFTESQVNRLTSDELDPYSKIAAFKLSAVRIEVAES